jgi:hypothetical protein
MGAEGAKPLPEMLSVRVWLVHIRLAGLLGNFANDIKDIKLPSVAEDAGIVLNRYTGSGREENMILKVVQHSIARS